MKYFSVRKLPVEIVIIFLVMKVIGIPAVKAENSRKTWFQAGPKSYCNFFLLCEFGYLNRIALDSKLPDSYYDKPFLFTWELGFMLNVT